MLPPKSAPNSNATLPTLRTLQHGRPASSPVAVRSVPSRQAAKLAGMVVNVNDASMDEEDPELSSLVPAPGAAGAVPSAAAAGATSVIIAPAAAAVLTALAAAPAAFAPPPRTARTVG